jgi:hypothetical protein
MVLGLAGALPYLGTSMTTIYLAKEAGLAAAGNFCFLGVFLRKIIAIRENRWPGPGRRSERA